MASEGNSWYNGLEVSLTKWLNHGLQFLASYTFSKTLDTDGADITRRPQDLASIVTVQSGNALTIANTNPSNVFGICEDRAELAPN
jgi:hypothetical protein